MGNKLIIMHIYTKPHNDKRLVNFQYVTKKGQPLSAWFQTTPAQIENMRNDNHVKVMQ